MADGPIASRLHIFIDKENESGVFDVETEPTTLGESIALWTAAFSEGIKEMMATANGLGIGMPGLIGIDDAFAAEFTEEKVQGSDFWTQLDAAIALAAQNIVDNSAMGTFGAAGFQVAVNPPTGVFDTATSATSPIETPRHGDPIYLSGVISEGTPPTLPPPGSGCARHEGGPEPEAGTPPEIDTGYDLANRVEDFTVQYLLTAVAHIFTSPPPASVPIPVPLWLIPPPAGSGVEAKKSHTIRDIVDDIIKPTDKERLNPAFLDEEADPPEEGQPFSSTEQEDLFKMLLLVLELSAEEAEDDAEDEGIKSDAISTSLDYLNTMISFGSVEFDSDLNEKDFNAYEISL